MSHPHFAEVWIQLEKRTDIDNILCELIGQHNLETSVLDDDSSELLNSTLRFTAHVKAIFDLQRTYSLPSETSHHSPHLLRPRQLFLTIVYLLRLKSRVFHQPNAPTTHYVDQRSFMAQAVVSGLRTLWLQKYQPSQDEIDQLRSVHHEAWDGDDLTGSDNFLIRTLCPKIFDELSCPSSSLSSPACGEVKFRDYDTGLYPLESRPDELAAATREASSNLQPERPNWLRSYWVLFDIAWTTEAALIQLCVNSAKKQKGTKVDSPTSDDIDNLRVTQEGIWNMILGLPAAMKDDWQSTVRNSIAMTVLAYCFKEDCECFAPLRAQPVRQLYPQATTSRQSSPTGDHRLRRPITEASLLLDESLVSLAAALSSRKEELRDCNGELRDLSKSLDDYIDDWYSDASSIGPPDHDSRSARREAYIIPCEKLHPIPYDTLNGLIKDSERKVGLERLEDCSPLFDVDISCSQCPHMGGVHSARRIEPLYRISAAIESKILRKPSTPRVCNSTGSSRMCFDEKNMTPREGTLDEFFGEVPEGLTLHAFSADGHTLLLWTRYGDSVISYDVRSGQHEKFSAVSVSFVAGGADDYAVVSMKGGERKLYVYQKQDGRLTTAPFDVGVPVHSIAMSNNDEFVALGSVTEVIIYRVASRQLFHHRLSSIPNRTLPSQRVCFSAESRKFLVATRNGEGNVQIHVNECMSTTTAANVVTMKMPTSPTNDFGLSSAFYDDTSGCAYITAFTGRARPVILSLKNRLPRALDDMDHRHLGTQIQCAALSPSGSKFILVNERNEIFSVQLDSPTRYQIEKTDPLRRMRKNVVARQDMMSIAMPEEEVVHLFWIRRNKWTLITISSYLNAEMGDIRGRQEVVVLGYFSPLNMSLNICDRLPMRWLRIDRAGVTGLQTALFLLEAGVGVTLVAKHWPEDRDLGYTSPCESESATPHSNIWWSSFISDFQVLPPSSIPPNAGFTSGISYTSFCLSPPRYLHHLLALCIGLGAKTQTAGVTSLSELFRLPSCEFARGVVNCTGLSALDLVGDQAMFPTKGQTVLVRGQAGQIRVGSGTESEVEALVIPQPGSDATFLGGCKLAGDWSSTIDDEMTQTILQRCRPIAPELLNTDGEFEILSVQVGRRPSRKGGARVELEWLETGGREK
ncbi:hypothetical protein GP486_001415, partial [Trichoglossum hirsutum]